MQNEKLKKLTLAGVFSALTAIFTLLIQIPSPTKGYINTGDVLVNLSAWVLGPVYGSAAAGLGGTDVDGSGRPWLLIAGSAHHCRSADDQA